MTTIHPGLGLTGGLASASSDKTQSAQEKGGQSRTDIAVSGSSSEVEITHAAQVLASVAQQISASPDISQSRVDAIRHALTNGSYQINSGSIADGVLAADQFNAQASAGAGNQANLSTVRAFAATAKLGSDQS